MSEKCSRGWLEAELDFLTRFPLPWVAVDSHVMDVDGRVVADCDQLGAEQLISAAVNLAPILLRELQEAEQREEVLKAEISVLRGEWCQGNREEGRGGCGLCPFCMRELATRLEDAEVLISQLRSQLQETKT